MELEAARAIVRKCAYECSVSEAASFNYPDPVWLENAGTYVIDSCMCECRDKAFGMNVETANLAVNATIDAGKQFVAISVQEVSETINSYALIAAVAVIATIGIYWLYRAR